MNESILQFDPRSRAVLIRQSSLPAGTTDTVVVHVPKSLLVQSENKPRIRLKLTCLIDATIDRNQGRDMIRSTVTIACKNSGLSNTLHYHRYFWDVCKQYSYELANLHGRECIFQLSAYGKGSEKGESVEYALVISLDESSEGVDISSAIASEGRYPVLNSVDSRIRPATTEKIGTPIEEMSST